MIANYTYLAEILVAAESSNLAEAAQRLHISPAAMSKHLVSLESDLGCTLLERDRHTFRLTEAGQAVYEAGSPLLAIGPQVEKAAQQANPFRILVLFDSTDIHQLLTRTLRALYSQDKNLNIMLVENSDSRNPFTSVVEGDIGLVIHQAISNQPVPKQLQSNRIATVSFVAIMRASHPLANRKSLYIEDLRNWPLIRLEGNFQLLDHMWNAVRDDCLAAGFQPTSHLQHIYHPAGGGLIDVAEDEIYILPDGSQNMATFRDDPAFACLPIDDMRHEAFATFDPNSTRAQQFAAALEQQVEAGASTSDKADR